MILTQVVQSCTTAQVQMLRVMMNINNFISFQRSLIFSLCLKVFHVQVICKIVLEILQENNCQFHCWRIKSDRQEPCSDIISCSTVHLHLFKLTQVLYHSHRKFRRAFLADQQVQQKYVPLKTARGTGCTLKNTGYNYPQGLGTFTHQCRVIQI